MGKGVYWMGTGVYRVGKSSFLLVANGVWWLISRILRRVPLTRFARKGVLTIKMLITFSSCDNISLLSDAVSTHPSLKFSAAAFTSGSSMGEAALDLVNQPWSNGICFIVAKSTRSHSRVEGTCSKWGSKNKGLGSRRKRSCKGIEAEGMLGNSKAIIIILGKIVWIWVCFFYWCFFWWIGFWLFLASFFLHFANLGLDWVMLFFCWFFFCFLLILVWIGFCFFLFFFSKWNWSDPGLEAPKWGPIGSKQRWGVPGLLS